MLGPELYSEYFSLISIWYLAAMPSSVLQTVITKQIAHYSALNNEEELRESLRVGAKFSALWGLGIGFALLVATPIVMSTLKTTNILAFVLIVLLIVTSYLAIPFLSFYIAKEKYLTFSLLSATGILGRIVFVIPLLITQATVVNVFTAMLIGLIGQLSLSALFVHRDVSSKSKMFARILSYIQRLTRRVILASEVQKGIIQTLKTSFIATFGLAALTQFDIILARSRLTPEDAGLYASLAITGRIIPFFTLPLTGVLLPQITAKIARKEEYRSTILLAATLVGLGSSSIAIFYALFPNFVISMFMGNQYMGSAPYLGAFGIFQTLYALTSLGVMACIAMNNFKAASIVTVCAIIQLIGMLLLPATILNIITVSIISVAIAVIYYGFILLKKTNS